MGEMDEFLLPAILALLIRNNELGQRDLSSIAESLKPKTISVETLFIDAYRAKIKSDIEESNSKRSSSK